MAQIATTGPIARQGNLVALVTAVRWGTTTVGLMWSAILEPRLATLVFGIILLAYALWRTLRPVEYSGREWRSLLAILGELTLSLTAIVGTNCWNSPYIFVLFTPVIAAGFERGIWHSLRVAVTGIVAVTIAALALGLNTDLASITSWSCELILVACVASYGRHLLERAEIAAAVNLTQLRRLNQANALLVSLNRLAHDLPASFDLQLTIESAVEDVHSSVGAEITALLLLDRFTGTWSVAHARGARLPEAFTKLPTAIDAVARKETPRFVAALTQERPGLSPTSVAGIYAPLWSGTTQVGLLAIETTKSEQLDDSRLDVVNEVAEQVALAVDNARWFERLQARGAAQERSRIARDLHDRVGQGVAYVAFELDRLCESAEAASVGEDLQRLRDDARTIVGELREALYDLRTDVSEQQSLVSIIDEFLGRVHRRSGISVAFDYDEQRRLPVSEEREVWRITQEAIVNAERHSHAEHVQVNWRLDERGGLLVVRDDGGGIASQISDDRASYGITGMRERADVIGARLEITSAKPQGTIVMLSIGTAGALPNEPTAALEAAEEHGVRT